MAAAKRIVEYRWNENNAEAKSKTTKENVGERRELLGRVRSRKRSVKRFNSNGWFRVLYVEKITMLGIVRRGTSVSMSSEEREWRTSTK